MNCFFIVTRIFCRKMQNPSLTTKSILNPQFIFENTDEFPARKPHSRLFLIHFTDWLMKI